MSERTRLQAGIAISAATRTVWSAKVRVLGRALASGLLADDDATIDAEMLILAAMADIEARDLSLLELLANRVPPKVAEQEQIAHPRTSGNGSVAPLHRWTEAAVAQCRPHLKPALPSPLGTLQRHGLIMLENSSFDVMTKLWDEIEQSKPWRDDSPLLSSFRFLDLVPDQSWSATDLGELVLERCREAGADLPDGWAPSKSNASGS